MVLHGRTDAQGGALVPLPVESIHFIRAVGPHVRHEPGGHMMPLALVIHGGGGRVPGLMAKDTSRPSGNSTGTDKAQMYCNPNQVNLGEICISDFAIRTFGA